MSERVYRPASGWDDDLRVNVPSITVFGVEPESYFSGLYDASGNKLMVSIKPEPIGFVVFSKSGERP